VADPQAVFLALITAAALQGRALRRAGAEAGLARYLALSRRVLAGP
jgi:hypothetical protein